MSFPILKAKVIDTKLYCMNEVLTTPKAGAEMLTSLSKEYKTCDTLKENPMLS